MNIQNELIEIHHKYGVSELANYKIQLLFETYLKEYVDNQLKIYSIDFDGLYPVGNCLILAAHNKEQAEVMAQQTIGHTSEIVVNELTITEPEIIKYLSGNYKKIIIMIEVKKITKPDLINNDNEKLLIYWAYGYDGSWYISKSKNRIMPKGSKLLMKLGCRKTTLPILIQSNYPKFGDVVVDMDSNINLLIVKAEFI